MGIVGLGQIGRAVMQRLKPFGVGRFSLSHNLSCLVWFGFFSSNWSTIDPLSGELRKDQLKKLLATAVSFTHE